jgi:hypothetical protein
MKIFLLLALALLGASFHKPSTPALSEQLLGMNPEWSSDKMSDQLRNKRVRFASDKDFITAHFMEVEKILASKNISHLPPARQQARKKHLENLHRYYQRAQYPMNKKYQGRRPCFIDEEGTTCAVAQLLIDDGKEELARKIAAGSNYAFIREMDYEELKQWQESSGLTIEELGLIQPSYSGDGWGGNRRRSNRNIIFELEGYARVGTSWMATAAQGLTPYPLKYSPGTSFAYGANAFIPLKKDREMFFITGAGLLKRSYIAEVEGNMGTPNSYGKVLLQHNIDYMSIPALVAFDSRSRSNRSQFFIGIVTDIFSSSRYSGYSFGAATPEDLHTFAWQASEFRRVNPNLHTGFSFGKSISGRQHPFGLGVSGAASYALLSDKNKKAGSNSHPWSISAGAWVSYAATVDPRKKAARQKKREEKRKQEEQEKEKKKSPQG